MFSFLPVKIKIILKNIECQFLYELRFRAGFPVTANYKNKRVYLTNNGIDYQDNDAVICTLEDIKQIINVVTEQSLYAFNDRIKQGFITTRCGVRIGIAGDCVIDNGQVTTIKNINSLNIRIPHDIEGCANKLLKYVNSNGKIYSSLLISPPTCGKTTMLKDLIKKLNTNNIGSILVIDERGEFNHIGGVNIDTIRYSDKFYAFNYGIRSLSPSIIITDELSEVNDWKCAESAVNSGVKIIATCHGGEVDDIIKKRHFIKGIFDRYIVLKNDGIPGIIKNVYDKDYILI